MEMITFSGDRTERFNFGRRPESGETRHREIQAQVLDPNYSHLVRSQIVITDVSWSPLLSLQRATHVTLQALTEQLAELDLSASEVNILANLRDCDGCTVGELATRAGSRSSTLTNVLDRLERRGLLRRVARVGDRRAVQIDLTEDGRAAAAAIRHAIDDLEQAALGALPAATMRGLRRGLQALAEPSS